MTIRHFLVPAFLVLCVLLGGASRAGFLPNLILQLIAIPIIVAALASKQTGQSAATRTLMMLAVAMIVVVVIHLIPLPPSLWSELPERERVAGGYSMLDQALPWLSLSIQSDATLAALLWLLPAIAGLLGVLRLGAYRGTSLAWFLIGATVISVMVASLQLTGGRDSPFYFYEVTNFGYGVGFFANANHQATLLLCTAPFLAALYANKGKSRSAKSSSGLIMALVGVALVLLVGMANCGSLAGIGLGAGVALCSLLLVRYRAKSVPAWAPILGAAALVGASMLFILTPLSGFLQGAQSSASSRAEMVSTTAGAAVDYMPLGSGIGTFPSVYPMFEDPASIRPLLVNHAHNDYAEIALEAGLPGLLLILVFLLWWGRRAYAIWLKDERPDHFARAAVIASAAVLAHSMVDYPLRTAAISTIFAVCVALMAQPRSASKSRAQRSEDGEGVRHLTA